MDKDGKQAVLDFHMAKYVKQAYLDIRYEPIQIFDLLENDFSAFLNENAETIPLSRRELLLAYTEQSYVLNKDSLTKDGMTKKFLADAGRAMKLASEIHRKKQ